MHEGEVRNIVFNTNGQPIGDDSILLASWTSMLARSKVRIIYKNWKVVPDGVKDSMWTCLQDELRVQAKEGKIITQGSKDILSMALGTPEHGGHVRAAGGRFTPTVYFHLTRRGSKKHASELESSLRQEQEKRMEEEDQRRDELEKRLNLEQRFKELEIKLKELESGLITPPMSEKVVSNSNKSDNRNHITSKVERREYETSSKRHQGCGPEDKLHTVVLGVNNVRVSIDEVIYDDVLLHIRGDELVTVRNVHKSHVAWPKEFVLKDVESKTGESSSNLQVSIDSFKEALQFMLPNENDQRFPLENIFLEETMVMNFLIFQRAILLML
ncbi:hypothetical protein FRX31_022863 [Thalictrum thalictroides]|uniref:Uncharacterized protein n=1 Tax=Thalictrum thalictroides TaxID=46969 RepID=A0A7J6VTN7_THATH|nr:hypothetical protein FRX31_022863 [Thalictrum thalictroides]